MTRREKLGLVGNVDAKGFKLTHARALILRLVLARTPSTTAQPLFLVGLLAHARCQTASIDWSRVEIDAAASATFGPVVDVQEEHRR